MHSSAESQAKSDDREGRRSRFLVSSAPGLETLLAEEIQSIGVKAVVEASGAVTFSGNWRDVSRVIIRSRIASRVSLSLRRFASHNQAMLYDQIRRMDWPRIFSHERSIFIKATGSAHDTDFALSFAPLKIKDAICDEFRKLGHPRPNVDRHQPDVRLNAFFYRGRCELSIDLTGQALHRRGYRQDGAEAPLRENRAAALLRFSGYDGSRPLVDPFCGSGTILIEAALIATHTAPGLLRDPGSFSLVDLHPEAESIFKEAWNEAAAERLDEPPHPIRGLEISKTARDTALTNIRRAGVEPWVHIQGGDARKLVAPESWIVTNPPYGERLEDTKGAIHLLKEFIHQVKHHCVGSRVGLVVPRGELEKSVGLRPEKRIAVQSGPLKLRYLCYAIREGRFTNRGISS